MQARYYDPVIGRFLAVDPVGFSPVRPDMFNRYAYVGNDPVNMVDPDGECAIICTAIIGGVIGAAVEAYKVQDSGGDIFTKEGGMQILKGAAIGAAAGALGPLAGGGAKLFGAGRMGQISVSTGADIIGQPVVGMVGEKMLSPEDSTLAETAVAGTGSEVGAVVGVAVDNGIPRGKGVAGAIIRAGTVIGSATAASNIVDAIIPEENKCERKCN